MNHGSFPDADIEISISVVIPVYSGEAYLESLVSAIADVRRDFELAGAPLKIGELLFVDDSAIDASPEIIDRLSLTHPWVHAIHLSRNFGQHAATIAGILHTSGDWVVTMDEDFQHPPEKIVSLLRHAISVGSDVVYAKPIGPVHERLYRDTGSRFIKNLMTLSSGNVNATDFNSFRLMRGSIARAVSSVCGHDTYFDVAMSWFVNRVSYLPMVLKDRRMIEGRKSGYRFRRLLSHARKFAMSSQLKIIRLVGLVGLTLLGTSLLFGLYVIINRVFWVQAHGTAGWTSLVLIALVFGSFVTVMLGIVLEYVSALLLVSHGKPVFFVVDRSSDKSLSAFFSRHPE